MSPSSVRASRNSSAGTWSSSPSSRPRIRSWTPRRYKTRDITLSSREAALQVKEDIQTKIEEAWQRGFDTATRNFEKVARMHAPPSSARMASFGRDSWRSESGDD